jgi:sugar transferase (PEP-CTERM/EpsH1 system associated)
MDSLLFLAHRLPFPPNKGDKVRSCHFLRHLAGRYRVFLGTFIDDPADWQHVETVKKMCAGVHVEALVPWSKRLRSATGLLTHDALTLPYFRSKSLSDWVSEVVRRERITRTFAYSSPMAQYALGLPQMRCIVDFVDLDSAKWGDYAQRRPWPLAALYRREAARLLEYERHVAERAEGVVFVTQEEANLFCAAAPGSAHRVAAIRNGVDSDYFSPSREFASPFSSGEKPIVFTGAMDYWPNIDAVVWFARDILPQIRRRDPSACFYVVGMNPDASVRALANGPHTVVTGRVPDVRPYLRHARVVVAPMRVARGIQNKVLEAMAMAKPVVASAATAVSLSAQPGVELEVANEATAFAEKVLALMDPERAERIGTLARASVLREHAWPTSFEQLDQLLERSSTPPPVAERQRLGAIRCAMPAS